ncbi:hypothetical protein HS7_08690 [Sulfolobales archaeon HS-7]|nr:hypothetical protein HS7_08350 [Sulfolobales archaeon HS-7]BCU67432.1 hypothetical protein HS7_08690 [Sulfolobales archaeon HS-7]
MRGEGINSSPISREITPLGEVAGARSRENAVLREVLRLDLLKILMVCKVKIVLANVSDFKSPICNVITLVDRGFAERGKVIRVKRGLGVLGGGALQSFPHNMRAH